MLQKRPLVIILGGGRGTRLYPLTKYRAKPAVPIGGKYRLIDIPISNCINSKMMRIYVLTQFNTRSLHRHIYQTYRFDRFSFGFVEILAAQQTLENRNWYQGTADAVRQNLPYIRNFNTDHILILSGDHLYRMDYNHFLRTHVENHADITISCKPISEQRVSEFGIVRCDSDGHILEFAEKPSNPETIKRFCTENPKKPFLASMGIYIFNRDILCKVLEECDRDDFGKHVLPYALEKYHVHLHLFEDYWEDIGTISSFYKACIELTDLKPRFSFYNPMAPIYSRERSLPGSRFEYCSINRSLIAEGCFIQKSNISNSVIGFRTIIRKGSTIENSIIMGADFYQQSYQVDLIPVGIGENSVIKNAIIDKNVRIGRNVQIVNAEGIRDKEEDHYVIRDGIVVIPKNEVIPDNTII